jgi:integrase
VKEKRERGTGGLFRMKGSENWYAQIYVNGQAKRVTTKTPIKEDAQKVLRKLLNEADQGKPFAGDLKKIRYGDLRAGLMQNYAEKGNKSLLADGEGEDFINGLKTLDQFFGFKNDKPGVPVTQMTTDAGRKFAQERLAEGVTNSTVNNSLALLRRMLRIAYEDGKLQYVPKIRLLKANAPRKGFVTREQFGALIKHLPEHLKPLITFLYYTGVRLGEALQVEWTQVDLKAPMIRLEDEQTKTGEARAIPLTTELVAMLKTSTKEGNQVFDGTNLRKAWNAACTAAGLGVQGPVDKAGNRRYTGLIIHDLRRSAIRNLVKAGVPEKVAMTISGHKTRSVFDRYHIVDEADVLAAMKRVVSAAEIAPQNLITKNSENVSESSSRQSVRRRLTA